MWRTFECFQAGVHLTFGERVGLNHVQKRVDHVEKNTDGTRFIIRVRFVHHRRHEAKSNGALNIEVREDELWCSSLLVRPQHITSTSPTFHHMSISPFRGMILINNRMESEGKDRLSERKVYLFGMLSSPRH